MPAHPAAGAGGCVWIDEDKRWMIAHEVDNGGLVCEALHPWLLKCGHRPADDTFSVHIVTNLLNNGGSNER